MNKVYAIIILIIIVFFGTWIYKKISREKSIFEEPIIPSPLYEK